MDKVNFKDLDVQLGENDVEGYVILVNFEEFLECVEKMKKDANILLESGTDREEGAHPDFYWAIEVPPIPLPPK